MKMRIKVAIGGGLVGVLCWAWAPADENPDAFKLPDRAQAYAVDDAALRQARQQQDQAKADVVRARQQVLAESLASPRYKQAVALVESTNDAYQTLKRRVQGEMTKGDPRYQALFKDRDAAEEQIAAARRDSATPYPTFQDFYARKEKATNAIRDLEESTIDKAGGTAARTEWVAACRALDDLKSGQRARVEGSPQVAAAKQKAAQSQQAVDQLATKLAGSEAAYEEASYQQGKADQYNRTHRDTIDYWGDTGGYGYNNVTIYRAPRMRVIR